jgi:lipid-A-disaccharide synthase-like uncharacterized protein
MSSTSIPIPFWSFGLHTYSIFLIYIFAFVHLFDKKIDL